MKIFYQLILAAMLLVGCAPVASAPRNTKPVVVSASWPAMGFGILLDEKLVGQSLDLPARNFDIKAGDKLLDVRPLSDIQGAPKDVVPFENKEAIRNLLQMANQDIYDHGKPAPTFVIRLEREGSIKEVEITINLMGSGPEAEATATPAPMAWFYY